jgi:hypothetical protein
MACAESNNRNDDDFAGLRATPAAPASTSAPLSTLATIVRTVGVVGGADRALLDGWARHVETGTDAPGRRRSTTQAIGDDARDEDDARDWTGLCGAVARSLENRAAHDTRTIEDLQTKLAVAHQDRREQEDRDVMDDLLIREQTRVLARAAHQADGLALRALVHDATVALAALLDERCARRNQSTLDVHHEADDGGDGEQGGGALVDDFDALDDDEPTLPALRSALAAADRPNIVRWRQ